MNPKISIILPIYNVEKYLEQCVDSILKQTFTDFELILVDDGSTDGSVTIENNYEKNDSRIKLIRKEHTNAGDARNKGMEIAQGKYIIFLDSDDFFEQTILEDEFLKLEEDAADMCGCNGNHYNERTGEFESVDFFLMKKYLPAQIPFCVDDCSNHIFQVIATGPWLRMYRMEFLRKWDLKYQSIVRGNDVFFSNMALALAKRITIVDKVLVHHRIGLSRNLQSGLRETPDIYLDIELKLRKELEKKNVYEKCYRSFGLYVLNNLRAHLSIPDEDAKNILRKRINDGILNELDFISYCEEMTKKYISHPEQYGVWEEVGWVDSIRLIFKNKNGNLLEMVDRMEENQKRIEDSAKEFDAYNLFPFEFIPRECRVIIYGLGKIGKGYIKQIKISHWCEIAGVSDKENNKNKYCYPFYTIEELARLLKYDKIIIAIGNQEIAQEVEEEMISKGIPANLIFRLGNKRHDNYWGSI